MRRSCNAILMVDTATAKSFEFRILSRDLRAHYMRGVAMSISPRRWWSR